jgi:hypothetical protein
MAEGLRAEQPLPALPIEQPTTILPIEAIQEEQVDPEVRRPSVASSSSSQSYDSPTPIVPSKAPERLTIHQSQIQPFEATFPSDLVILDKYKIFPTTAANQTLAQSSTIQQVDQGKRESPENGSRTPTQSDFQNETQVQSHPRTTSTTAEFYTPSTSSPHFARRKSQALATRSDYSSGGAANAGSRSSNMVGGQAGNETTEEAPVEVKPKELPPPRGFSFIQFDEVDNTELALKPIEPIKLKDFETESYSYQSSPRSLDFAVTGNLVNDQDATPTEQHPSRRRKMSTENDDLPLEHYPASRSRDEALHVRNQSIEYRLDGVGPPPQNTIAKPRSRPTSLLKRLSGYQQHQQTEQPASPQSSHGRQASITSSQLTSNTSKKNKRRSLFQALSGRSGDGGSLKAKDSMDSTISRVQTDEQPVLESPSDVEPVRNNTSIAQQKSEKTGRPRFSSLGVSLTVVH